MNTSFMNLLQSFMQKPRPALGLMEVLGTLCLGWGTVGIHEDQACGGLEWTGLVTALASSHEEWC